MFIACGVCRLEDYVQILEKEVGVDYCRSMNRIIFDKTVRDDPATFAFVTLPEPEVTHAPEKGRAMQLSLSLSPSLSFSLHL